MNMPVVQNVTPQLPAHLQRHMNQTSVVAADVMSGLSAGAVHSISIRGRRWALQDPQGQEFPVPTFHLDVILVGANPHVSKTFYASKWNPQEEGKAPDCWSDNGVGPSSRASAPQCLTCQLCPNNAWGSRISETGNQVKACADSKKIAVLLADNPTGPVYQLKVPADSLKNMAIFAKTVASSRGAPLDRIIMRLEFDPAVPHPKIVFSSPDYINPAQDAAVDEVLGSEEITEALNLSDIAIKAVPQIAQAPATQAPIQAPQMAAPQPAYVWAQSPQYAVPNAPVATANVAPVAVTPAKRRRKAQAVPEGATPVATAPQYAPQPQTPAVQQVYLAPPGLPAAAAPHPVMPTLVAAPQLLPENQMPPIPPSMRRVPDVPGAQTAAASVPLQPQPTDNALDAILGNAMARA